MSSPFETLRTAGVGADVMAAGFGGIGGLRLRQQQRIDQLLAFAAGASAYYRRRLDPAARSAPSLARFPIVRKGELMAEFDDWVTDPAVTLPAALAYMADPARIGEAFLGRYTLWQSSGSSGEPAVFVQDPDAMGVYDALEALRRPAVNPLRRLFDPWYLSERVAFVGATSGHFASTVSLERLRRLNPAIGHALQGFSFLRPIAELVADLNAYRPSVLTTYPTAAVLLAEEFGAGRLDVAPREVWTGGESLTAGMRQTIERLFGCPVVNQYGASEFLPIATECRHGRLHHNADWSVLESVDEEGRPVPDGETGRSVLLTNLANRVQPIIRYDLGDRIRLLAAPCDCGSPLPLIEVEGRTDEALVLRDGRGRLVRLVPLALATVLEDDAQVFDFQIEQTGPTTVVLRLGPGQADPAAAAARAVAVLQRWFGEHGLAAVAIDCRGGEPLVRGRSGKIKRVIGLPEA